MYFYAAIDIIVYRWTKAEKLNNKLQASLESKERECLDLKIRLVV